MNTRKTISAISLSALLALGLTAAPAQAGHRDHGQSWQSEYDYQPAGHGNNRRRAYERGFENGYRKGFRQAKKRFKRVCRERHGHGGRHGERHGGHQGYGNWGSSHDYQPREYTQPTRHGGSFIDVLFDTVERDLRLIVHRENDRRW